MQWTEVARVEVLNTSLNDLIDQLKDLKKEHGRHIRVDIKQQPFDGDYVLVLDAMKPVLTEEEVQAEVLRKTIEAYSK